MRASDIDTLINILTKARKKHGNVQVVMPVQDSLDILLYVPDVHVIEGTLLLTASMEVAIITDDQKYNGIIEKVAEIKADY